MKKNLFDGMKWEGKGDSHLGKYVRKELLDLFTSVHKRFIRHWRRMGRKLGGRGKDKPRRQFRKTKRSLSSYGKGGERVLFPALKGGDLGGGKATT